MKKTEVYVVVDTPKKAKKLKWLLDMFGERTYSESSIQDCLDNTENVLGFDKDENSFMSGYVNQFEDSRTKVSIKELRNILAKEHLKSGDIVVIKSIYNDEWVMEVDYIEGDKAYHKSAINKSSGYKDSKSFLVLNFIRYATEEEKDLLEPKKELEVGKWYLFDGHGCENKPLMLVSSNYNDRVYFCGFNFLNQWVDEDFYTNDDLNKHGYREATTQEIEQALIAEAKRRCYAYNEYNYNPEENELCGINDGRLESVFCNGHWEQPTSNFTDSDIAIVERLHDMLLDNHGYSLGSKLLTDARMLANKIKSNIK